LIGALIMTHSDDQGLILPPKMATNQVVIIPIWRNDDEKEQVLGFADNIYQDLKEKHNVIFDDREQYKPGYKFTEWEMQGIPVRIEIGPKDVEKNQVVIVARDNKEKIFFELGDLRNKIETELVSMQNRLYNRARVLREENTYEISDYSDFKQKIDSPGGFYNAFWCGSVDCEDKIKEDTKATIRLIPFDKQDESGKCLCCGNNASSKVVFAKAY